MTRPITPSTPSQPARAGERIAKLLARAGVASRREIERMIADGRVKLDGNVLTTPATVLESLRGVTVDDAPVAAAERTRLFAFHKPAGLITAERDPAGRPTIYNALVNALPPGTGRLMPVGRLDFSTEGLLLLTNDGEFKRALELPSSKVPRTYRARAFGDITQAQLDALASGITVDGMHYGKIIADMERRTGRNGWVVLTLTEGKNREVRRVLEHLGLEVSRLIRTSYGPFILGELPRGAAVELLAKDVDKFRASLGLAASKGVEPRRIIASKAMSPAKSAAGPASGKPGAKGPQRKRKLDKAAQDRAAFAAPSDKRAAPTRASKRVGPGSGSGPKSGSGSGPKSGLNPKPPSRPTRPGRPAPRGSR